jgi:hypothetical protein
VSPVVTVNNEEFSIVPAEFAVGLVRCWCESPRRWGSYEDPKSERYFANDETYAAVVAPHLLTDRNFRPEVGMRTYPGVELRPISNMLFALKFTWGYESPTLIRWWFVLQMQKSDEFQFLEIKPDCDIDSNGTITQKVGSMTREFSIDDSIWPWPALFPKEFEGVLTLTDLLTPDDCNPLSGLVQAPQAPIKVLAKQVAAQIRKARELYIADIVAKIELRETWTLIRII